MTQERLVRGALRPGYIRTVCADDVPVLARATVEFDTPLALFQKEGGVFQGMCAKCESLKKADRYRHPS